MFVSTTQEKFLCGLVGVLHDASHYISHSKQIHICVYCADSKNLKALQDKMVWVDEPCYISISPLRTSKAGDRRHLAGYQQQQQFCSWKAEEEIHSDGGISRQTGKRRDLDYYYHLKASCLPVRTKVDDVYLSEKYVYQ